MLDVIVHGGYVVTMEGKGTGIIPNGAVGIMPVPFPSIVTT